MSTNANVVIPIVSPLRSFLFGNLNATFENSIMPALIVRMTTIYFARTLSIWLNAVKNAILSGFSISCIALSKKRMPKTMIATESPKSAKSTFSVFVSCFTIILPLKFIKQL